MILLIKSLDLSKQKQKFLSITRNSSLEMGIGFSQQYYLNFRIKHFFLKFKFTMNFNKITFKESISNEVEKVYLTDINQNQYLESPKVKNNRYYGYNNKERLPNKETTLKNLTQTERSVMQGILFSDSSIWKDGRLYLGQTRWSLPALDRCACALSRLAREHSLYKGFSLWARKPCVKKSGIGFSITQAFQTSNYNFLHELREKLYHPPVIEGKQSTKNFLDPHNFWKENFNEISFLYALFGNGGRNITQPSSINYRITRGLYLNTRLTREEANLWSDLIKEKIGVRPTTPKRSSGFGLYWGAAKVDDLRDRLKPYYNQLPIAIPKLYSQSEAIDQRIDQSFIDEIVPAIIIRKTDMEADVFKGWAELQFSKDLQKFWELQWDLPSEKAFYSVPKNIILKHLD